MYSFSKCEAHPGKLLHRHLEDVAQGVRVLWGDSDSLPAKTAVFSALIHDAGKANHWFQERIHKGLTKKDERSYHSRLSAIIAWHIFSGLRCNDVNEKNRFRLCVLVAVLKHHGNLDRPWTEILTDLKGDIEEAGVYKILLDQFESLDIKGISLWLAEALKTFEIPIDLPEISLEASLESLRHARPFRMQRLFPNLEQTIDFLHIYGSLLQADKIHAASGKVELARLALSSKLVDNYRKLKFGSPGTELERLRHTIYLELEQNLITHQREKFFTVTAPTGSGKTLAALNAALKLRSLIEKETGNTPRIIYCLPFTSIIDQNYQVYREVLEKANLRITSDLLLKHHHLSDMQYSSSDAEFEVDGTELFVETWQSEIVVTTFYQLLYTIFTNRNRNLKRFAQLQNAIILMDEVQAIPRKYWDPIRHVFMTIGEKMGTRFLLLTATKPLLFLESMSRELIPNHSAYFTELSRVKLINRTQQDLTLTEFFHKIAAEMEQNTQSSRMVVVNQRRAVKELFYMADKRFPNRPIFCLSANMTPLDRKNKIDRIKNLKAGLPCLIITTQLIEAGVDLSVDTVDRDIAPLDSIIQAAGRCNRHGTKEAGTVNVWSLVTEKHRPYHWKVYDPLLMDVTKGVLKDCRTVEENRFHELAQTYFTAVYKLAEASCVEQLLVKGEFRKLRDPKEGFVLIEEMGAMQPYFIIQNDEDRNIWERFEALQELDDHLEKKRLFYKLRFPFLERVVQIRKYGRSSDLQVIPLDATPETYSPDFGFINSNPEDNIPTTFF